MTKILSFFAIDFYLDLPEIWHTYTIFEWREMGISDLCIYVKHDNNKQKIHGHFITIE